MSKKNDWVKAVTFIAIIFAVTVIFISIWTTKIHFNFNGKCRFENIEYVDLAENISCWNNDDTESYWETIDGELELRHTAEDTFLNEYCPMPQTVDCDISLTMPFNVPKIVEFINEMN